jgi:hypothetical protein
LAFEGNLDHLLSSSVKSWKDLMECMASKSEALNDLCARGEVGFKDHLLEMSKTEHTPLLSKGETE